MWISESKKEDNFRLIWENPIAKIFYQTFKNLKKQQQPCTNITQLETVNEFFSPMDQRHLQA